MLVYENGSLWICYGKDNVWYIKTRFFNDRPRCQPIIVIRISLLFHLDLLRIVASHPFRSYEITVKVWLVCPNRSVDFMLGRAGDVIGNYYLIRNPTICLSLLLLLIAVFAKGITFTYGYHIWLLLCIFELHILSTNNSIYNSTQKRTHGN